MQSLLNNRARRIRWLLALVALVAAAAPAAAQGWPQRHISMVVPFAAGSSSDAVGRIVAAGVSEILGQQVIVEDRKSVV